MDENNNNNIENNEIENNSADNRWEAPPEQQPPQNPFKNWRFYVAYFAMIIIPFVISLIITSGDFWVALVIMSLISIPYGIVGVIIWAIVRRKNKAVALGILLGGMTPFNIACIALGGCALVLGGFGIISG